MFHRQKGVPSYPTNCAGETEKKFLSLLFLLIRRSLKRTNRFFLILESFYACPCDQTFFTQRNLPCALIFFHGYSKYRALKCPYKLFKMPLALFHNRVSVLSYPSNCAGETEKKFLSLLFLLIRRSLKRTNRFFLILESFYACPCDQTFFTQRNLPCALIFFHGYSKYRALKCPYKLFKMPLALFHNRVSVLSYPSNCAGETEKKFLSLLFLLIRRSLKRTNRFFLILESFYACPCDRNIFTQRNLPCALIFFHSYSKYHAL